ncbi:MAG: M1 family aminopeptidase [Halieaceae bacterium]|jgi:ABC-2 type transport system permease protein|nr:M1 family aminopeptidase [Halieaceae bacterium]
MFLKMLAFEWRYFVRQPSFIVTMMVFFLLPYLAIAIENVQIGNTSNTNFNSPYAITQALLILGIFSMFLVVNFVANTALRNDQVKLAEIICTKPVGAFSYQLGRFMGAYLVCATVFAMVPLGTLVGSWMPWLDAERIGPNAISYYLIPFLVFSLPTLFVLSVLFYAVALKFRSQVAVYLAAVVLFILYVVSGQLLDDPAYYTLAALTDPFGLRAFGDVSRYWTPFERDTLVVSVEGVVLQNRALWLGVAVILLAVFGGLWKPLAVHMPKEYRSRKSEKVETVPEGRRIDARPQAISARSQFATRTRFEILQVIKSPAFYVLLLFSGFSLISQLIDPVSFYDAPNWPLTQYMLRFIEGSFSLMLLIVIAYYSAEVVWRERGVGIGDIVDSLPVPNWVFWLSKLIAVCLVVASLFVVGAMVTIPYQLIKGFTDVDLGQYFITSTFFRILPASLMVVLAFLFHAFSPNKYVGMLLFVGFAFVELAFSEIGLEHNMWNFASSPSFQYSDINEYGWFLETQSWYMLYWLSLALVFGVVSYGLWQRGPSSSLRQRLSELSRSMGPFGKLATAAALLVFIGSGVFIHHNTRVLNTFRTQDESLDLLERYERLLVEFAEAPIPALTDIDSDVAIYPAEKRIEATAQVRVINTSDEPLSRFIVNMPDNSPSVAVEIDGGALEPQSKEQESLSFAWFAFDEPMQPGETREGTISVVRARAGFKDRGFDAVLVENGTFIDNFTLYPTFGFDYGRRIADRYERRKRGLPELERAFPLEDKSHYGENFLGKNSHLINFSATVSTSPDQIAIAPGYLVKEWEEGGRRFFRYEQDSPILNIFNYMSARAAVKRETYKGISIEVYYHPDHEWNIDRMIESVRDSLDYFTEQFGPYQHRQMRIIEFPGYRRFAQSFANTVPYSEDIGFITDLRNPDNIDPVYYVTAHEVAHQWWAHQVVPANVQGAAILSESLSQYSALMVMEKKYGEPKTRKFLTFELDSYLRGRTSELIGENPMLRSENQAYIHYRKGSIVMMALKDRLGEERLNRALKSMIEDWRPGATVYPTTLDLVAAIKAEADPEDHDFIDSQFNDITLYEFVNTESRAELMESGTYQVTVNFSAKRFVADSEGAEVEQPFEDVVDVVLFSGDPDDFGGKTEVLYRQKHAVKTGENSIVVTLDQRPDFAGVDPFVRYIDRNPDDNIRPVSGSD